MIIYGKRTRKPKQKDYLENMFNKPEYGHGTYATISIEYNKYIYCVYERSSTYYVNCNTWSLPFYTSFNTPEEAKEHIINNFGGTWKWK